MQIVWQSDEVQATERAADVTIPRDEFELPSVGPSYFWKVGSMISPLSDNKVQLSNFVAVCTPPRVDYYVN